MVGNEMVFDDIGAFNTAMASPVGGQLRAWYHGLARSICASTHDLMIRRRIAG